MRAVIPALLVLNEVQERLRFARQEDGHQDERLGVKQLVVQAQ